MGSFRRLLVTLALAATLPILAFSAVEFYLASRAGTAAVEQSATDRANRIQTALDSRLQAEFSALRILASAASFQNADWPAFYARALRARGLNPDWVTVALYDPQQGRYLFDLNRALVTPLATDDAPPPPDHAALAGRPVVGRVARVTNPPPPATVWIYLPVLRDARVTSVLVLGLDATIFQRILVRDVPEDIVAAVVDRSGRFIARTIRYDELAGTPATRYVRAAIAGADHGFYRGQTYEGFENYTAFRTSKFSGWSTHVAVASALIDTPAVWSTTAASLAGLGALILVGILAWLVVRDLEERRKAEQTMLQSQKMEAVGQLTGGIAHDFNNLLTAIIGNLSLLKKRVADRPDLQPFVGHAFEAASRAARLSTQLLAFSRSQRMALRPVDVANLLDGMRDLLAQTAGPAIEVAIEIDPHATHVVCDKNQLELAVLNLAVNARDAMPDGGRMVIATRVASALDRADRPAGDYVVISVSDDGRGMSDAVRSRALEPFFTTKPVGKGTGLGLAQVYGIVTESGGVVHLDSRPGVGTRVDLVLPAAIAAETDPLSEPLAFDSVSDQPPAPATILIVDDDVAVRAFLTAALESAGHRVIEEGSPARVPRIVDEERVDLVVIDYLMPQMTGAELVRILRERHPALRMLMISGHHDTAAVTAAARDLRILRKPFDAGEFLRTVHGVLDERG
jgi:signal transduction histidine kinase/CheY-like chemotaxis protein